MNNPSRIRAGVVKAHPENCSLRSSRACAKGHPPWCCNAVVGLGATGAQLRKRAETSFRPARLLHLLGGLVVDGLKRRIQIATIDDGGQLGLDG